jgi:hypothetical protein
MCHPEEDAEKGRKPLSHNTLAAAREIAGLQSKYKF